METPDCTDAELGLVSRHVMLTTIAGVDQGFDIERIPER